MRPLPRARLFSPGWTEARRHPNRSCQHHEQRYASCPAHSALVLPRSAFSWILDNEDRRGHRRRVPKKGNTGNRAEGGLTQKSTVPAGAFSRPAQSPGEGKVPFVLPRLPDARACDREIRLSVARPLHNGPGDRDRVCSGVASPLHQSSLVGQIVRVRRAHDRSRECAA